MNSDILGRGRPPYICVAPVVHTIWSVVLKYNVEKFCTKNHLSMISSLMMEIDYRPHQTRIRSVIQLNVPVSIAIAKGKIIFMGT